MLLAGFFAPRRFFSGSCASSSSSFAFNSRGAARPPSVLSDVACCYTALSLGFRLIQVDDLRFGWTGLHLTSTT